MQKKRNVMTRWCWLCRVVGAPDQEWIQRRTVSTSSSDKKTIGGFCLAHQPSKRSSSVSRYFDRVDSSRLSRSTSFKNVLTASGTGICLDSLCRTFACSSTERVQTDSGAG